MNDLPTQIELVQWWHSVPCMPFQSHHGISGALQMHLCQKCVTNDSCMCWNTFLIKLINQKIDRRTDHLNLSKIPPHQWTRHSSSTPFHQCQLQDSTEPYHWQNLSFYPLALTKLKQSGNHPNTTLVSSLISRFSPFHLDKWQGIDVLIMSESIFIGSIKVRSLSPTLF